MNASSAKCHVPELSKLSAASLNSPRLSKSARLSLRYIEAKPKVIGFVGDDLDIKVPLSPRQQDDLELLFESVEAGKPLPDRFYRPSMGRRGDDLLVNNKIMHLHLDGPSDALVYLIQYDDVVLIIQVNTHVHLLDKPEGKKFRADLISKAERELNKELASKLVTLLTSSVAMVSTAIGTSMSQSVIAAPQPSQAEKTAVKEAILKMMASSRCRKSPP